MALVLADRVRETTTTTGTGSVTLGGAYTGFQTFSAGIGNANNTYYTIANSVSGEWEVGIGTYTTSGNTLSRDTVLASSNAGSLVVFTAGSKDVFVTQPAERAVYVNAANTQVSVPQLAATSLTVSGTSTLTGVATLTANPVLSAGTANGVTYLNGSKSLTSGTGLVFDGTNLNIGTATSATNRFLNVQGSAVAKPVLVQTTTTTSLIEFNDSGTATKPAMGSVGDALAFLPAGTEGMRLTSTGLGIGTTSPTYKLDVTGISTVEPIARFTAVGTNVNAQLDLTPTGVASGIFNSTANNLGLAVAGSTKLTVLSTGNVGIGTSSPAALLDVDKSQNSTTSIRVGNTNAGSSANSRLIAVADAGNIQIKAMSSTNTTYGGIADAGVINCDNMSGGLLFAHNDTVGMTFSAAGNVGIGTTSPSGKLNVAGAASSYSLFTSTAGSTYLTMGNLDGAANNKYSYIGGSANYLIFGKVNDDLATRTEYMRIDPSGNVGIGTSSPTSKLSVNALRTTSSGEFLGGINAVDTTTGGATGVGGVVTLSGDTQGAGLKQFAAILGGKENSTLTDYAGYLGFYSRIGGGSLTERMRIDSSGYIQTPAGTSTLFGVGVPASNTTGGDLTVKAGNSLNTGTGGTLYLATGRAGGSSTVNGAIVFGLGYSTWLTGVLTEYGRFDVSGNLGIGTSSPARKFVVSGSADPTVVQITNTTSGVGVDDGFQIIHYASGETQLLNRENNATAFYTNNTERMRITSSGNILINRTTVAGAGNVGLIISGDTDTTSTNYTFYTIYSNNTQVFGLKNDGSVRADGVYNKTSAGVANVNVDSAGLLTRGTSALKYKQDIRNLEFIDINKFRPVRYKSKCEMDDQTIDHFGIIADEVDEANIKELVTYGIAGEVEGFQYERLTVVILKALQELKAEFDAYKLIHP